MQPIGGRREIGGNVDAHAVGVDFHRRAGFDNFLNRFHADPHARKTAQRKGVQTQIQNFLHRGGEKHRKSARHKNRVALVRGGGTFGDMVIARHRNHAAPRGCARHVRVLKNIGTAVNARPFAVPNAENAVIRIRIGRRKTELLRAPECGSGELFVDGGAKNDVVGL